MTAEQMAAVNNALNPGIQLALPQTVVPVTKMQHQVASTQYDPAKLAALKSALTAPRLKMGTWESLANALAQMPEARSFTGGFGEEIINPWAVGLSSLARGFGGTYGALKANEREVAEQEREDAIKAAQLEAEATKQAITDQVAKDYIKVNDPNAKADQAAQEQIKNKNVISAMSNELEDIGKRFDNSFKDIDEMQEDSTRWGRMWTNGMFGVGTTDSEKLARDQFKAWKGSMKNVLVNANRQAGSGSMSDADAARYEQDIGKAKTPAEARNILRSFEKRMNAENTKPVTMIDGYKVYQE
jgi:hypothetical protein